MAWGMAWGMAWVCRLCSFELVSVNHPIPVGVQGFEGAPLQVGVAVRVRAAARVRVTPRVRVTARVRVRKSRVEIGPESWRSNG